MSAQSASLGRRIAFFSYGLAVYLLFLVTFCYAIGFVGNWIVPKSIDSGVAGPIGTAIVINALLLGLFAIQHAVMARPGFKARLTRIVPTPTERSTFVLLACAALLLMYWQWRPMPEVVWSVTYPAAKFALYAICAMGWLLVLYATFCIDHFDLFGMRQVTLFLRGKEYSHPGFATPWIYRLVRNPLMLGFLLAFWSTPTMTRGHLLFAILTTGYILIGIQMEERDLLKFLGEPYRKYRERTPMLLPIPHRRPVSETGAAPAMPRTDV